LYNKQISTAEHSLHDINYSHRVEAQERYNRCCIYKIYVRKGIQDKIMTININNLGVNNNTLSNNRASESNRNQLGESATRPADLAADKAPTDNVELSPQALSLTSLEARINAAPDVDTARVESIRQSIENGSYSIDANDIADKLLNSDAV
jgi:negative regulator of flagellin synthesis FlgM